MHTLAVHPEFVCVLKARTAKHASVPAGRPAQSYDVALATTVRYPSMPYRMAWNPSSLLALSVHSRRTVPPPSAVRCRPDGAAGTRWDVLTQAGADHAEGAPSKP